MKTILNKFDDAWGYKPVMWLVCLLISVFLIWASVSEIDEQVQAYGRIIPAGKMRTIQHLEGGIVSEILVKEGQNIAAGEVLFIVKNQRAESEFKEIFVHLKSLNIRQMRLESERQSLTREQFNESFVSSFSDEDQKSYGKLIQSEKDLFNSRRQAFNEKINGLKERFRQKELHLNNLRTRIVNLRAELSISKEQLVIKKNLQKIGAISRSQYLETASQVKNFVTRVEQVQKEIPVTSAERDEVVNLLSETQQNRQSDIIDELGDLNIEEKKLNERAQPMKDQMERTEIFSPVRGIVNKLYINTIGGIIQPGGSIAEIIPLDEMLIVEGRIGTDDRGKVWPGLPVIAKITAYDYSLYGGIPGELSYISADSFTDQQNNVYYQVRANLKTTHLAKGKDVFPGMTVELSILSGKVSILHAVLRPFWKIRENALREK